MVSLVAPLRGARPLRPFPPFLLFVVALTAACLLDYATLSPRRPVRHSRKSNSDRIQLSHLLQRRHRCPPIPQPYPGSRSRRQIQEKNHVNHQP
ncbi:hypothetical protein Pcinc_008343 [Petrolisthes cinctipes]|uniref:Uncharacterized protein n=1 Tax=Petrolisthes cinctipes TaxID=88211 RepID=A0AAE1G6Y3_PETCI|nr:hypothetical protein Pcinc_008343 [Petrolisthes cinctipes]